MKLRYFIFLTVFLSACGTTTKPFSRIDYMGNSYPATDSVTVFVDPSAIEKPYTIIGKGFVKPSALGWQPLEKVQADAVKKAKENGADAVLIQDHLLPVGYNTVVHTDSMGNGVLTLGNATAAQAGTRNFTFLFLKYK